MGSISRASARFKGVMACINIQYLAIVAACHLLVLISSTSVSGAFNCEDLPAKHCAFAVTSTGARCFLESSEQDLSDYKCQTSELMAEVPEEMIETDDCITNCGLQRLFVGLSTDFLFQHPYKETICLSDCRAKCPNINDLFTRLAAGQGIQLQHLCDSLKQVARLLKEDFKEAPTSSQSLSSLSSSLSLPTSSSSSSNKSAHSSSNGVSSTATQNKQVATSKPITFRYLYESPAPSPSEQDQAVPAPAPVSPGYYSELAPAPSPTQLYAEEPYPGSVEAPSPYIQGEPPSPSPAEAPSSMYYAEVPSPSYEAEAPAPSPYNLYNEPSAAPGYYGEVPAPSPYDYVEAPAPSFYGFYNGEPSPYKEPAPPPPPPPVPLVAPRRSSVFHFFKAPPRLLPPGLG